MSAETIHRQMNPNLIKNISNGLLRLFSKDITLTGEEFIPIEGPAIIAANHMGILEVLPPYIYSSQAPIIFTKRENLKIPLFGNLLKNFGAIPVNRGEVDRQALRTAITMLVNQKKILFTCPEQN